MTPIIHVPTPQFAVVISVLSLVLAIAFMATGIYLYGKGESQETTVKAIPFGVFSLASSAIGILTHLIW